MGYIIFSLSLLIIGLAFAIFRGKDKQDFETPDRVEDLEGFQTLLLEYSPEEMAGAFLNLWQKTEQEEKKALKALVKEEGWEAYFLTSLNSTDKTKILKALEILAIIGSKKSLWPLMDLLGSKDEELSFESTAVLKEIATVNFLGNLVKALDNPEKWPPARVAEIILAKGEQARPYLEQGLIENSPTGKKLVQELIKEMERKKIIPVS